VRSSARVSSLCAARGVVVSTTPPPPRSLAFESPCSDDPRVAAPVRWISQLASTRLPEFTSLLERSASSSSDASDAASSGRTTPPTSSEAVIAALEVLEETDTLNKVPKLFALAVAALAATGETERAVALARESKSRGVPPTPALAGATVYALRASGAFGDALEVFRRSPALDARGYDAAMAAAYAVGDSDLAFAVLQRKRTPGLLAVGEDAHRVIQDDDDDDDKPRGGRGPPTKYGSDPPDASSPSSSSSDDDDDDDTPGLAAKRDWLGRA